MEHTSNATASSSFASLLKSQSPSMTRQVESEAWEIPSRSDGFLASNDATLFSSSLPVLPHEKLNFDDFGQVGRSNDDNTPDLLNHDAGPGEKDLLDDLELPDENELLAGLMDELDFNTLPNQVDDLEDYDLFGSGGGMELESETHESLSGGISSVNVSDGVAVNSFVSLPFANSVGTVSGEHPYGEHPSRTLFVRNINSNVEDAELRSLFELYGDIRTLYTACKHRGFVMISYYDIRAARTAMRALQNKPLRRRRLDIHFSIPKDNPSEKDLNQGTLVIFNLDPSVSNDDLLRIFGAYGEVKEIRETPNKRHHKFIEYYDVRAAEAALKALNRIDIAGKRIKLEPSRPGGARRSFMQQLSQELERDESQFFHSQVGSPPVANSPPGAWVHFGSPVERNPLHTVRTLGQSGLSPVKNNHLPGLASILPPHVSNSPKLAPIGKDTVRTGNANQMLNTSGSAPVSPYKQAISFSEKNPSPTSVSAFAESSSPSSGIGTLSGPQFLWGSPTHRTDHSSSTRSLSSTRHPYPSSGQNFPFASRNTLLGTHQHHVGSAPSGNHLERQFGFLPDCPDVSFMGSIGFGSTNFSHGTGSYVMNSSGHTPMNYGFSLPGNVTENGSPSFRLMTMSRPIFPGNGIYSGLGVTSGEGFFDRGRSQKIETNGIDNKKQYKLDLDKIVSGEDTRTTLMIKNIPNKYTSKMLLAAIDENHRGTYDFLYLPIDFKNKCNVGYAFINMVSPSHIISFYQSFNGKKWEKFNSEKVASLAYARIQGKTALVSHFQNSSLMNEDKRCRPIVFRSEGQEVDEQEQLLSSNLNICIRQADGTYSSASLESPRSNPDEKQEWNIGA